MDGLAADGFHALEKENGAEAASPDLVVYVPAVLSDADGRELVGQIGITDVALFELCLERTLNTSLPISYSHRRVLRFDVVDHHR